MPSELVLIRVIVALGAMAALAAGFEWWKVAVKLQGKHRANFAFRDLANAAGTTGVSCILLSSAAAVWIIWA